MQKTRQREWQCARGPAGLSFGLENFDAQPRLRQHNGRSQSVRARSNHDGSFHSRILQRARGVGPLADPADFQQTAASPWHTVVAQNNPGP